MLHLFTLVGTSKLPRAQALHNFFLVIIILTASSFASAAPVGFIRRLEKEPIGLLQNLHQRYRVWTAQRPFHAHTISPQLLSKHEAGSRGATIGMINQDLAAQSSQHPRKHEGATGADGLPASVTYYIPILDTDPFDIPQGAETVNGSEELLRDILWSE